jgi:hypothetical protein
MESIVVSMNLDRIRENVGLDGVSLEDRSNVARAQAPLARRSPRALSIVGPRRHGLKRSNGAFTGGE